MAERLSNYDKAIVKIRNTKAFTEQDMQDFAFYAYPKINKITLDVIFEQWKETKRL